MKNLLFAFIITFCLVPKLQAKDGYQLWLSYEKIEESKLRQELAQLFSGIYFFAQNPTYDIIKEEFARSAEGFLDQKANFLSTRDGDFKLLVGTRSELSQYLGLAQQAEIKNLGEEGYWRGPLEINGKKVYIVTGNSPIGVLYGSFDFLKSIQIGEFDLNAEISDQPKVKLRMLNHWDNLDRTVERGYAGFSIWDWHKLPGYIDPRYIDYARANASLGINAVSLTNVNANAWILQEDFIEKVKVLADLFRPYGIKVYLTARFSAPIEMGNMETADPLDSDVRAFWKERVQMIYQHIPDFGGFLVKANSEGQPGPHEYGRNHAEGANMLAEALAPFGGYVIWRAFVYSHEIDEDRPTQAGKS